MTLSDETLQLLATLVSEAGSVLDPGTREFKLADLTEVGDSFGVETGGLGVRAPDGSRRWPVLCYGASKQNAAFFAAALNHMPDLLAEVAFNRRYVSKLLQALELLESQVAAAQTYNDVHAYNGRKP